MVGGRARRPSRPPYSAHRSQPWRNHDLPSVRRATSDHSCCLQQMRLASGIQLIAQHGANCPMPELLGLVAAPPLPLLLRKFQSAMDTRGTHTSVGRYPDGTPNSLWPIGQATPVRTVDFDYVEI